MQRTIQAAAALFSFILLPGDGLLDFYLHRLGLGMVNWLGDPDLALGSVTAIMVSLPACCTTAGFGPDAGPP
jgi:ABC-type sugar transport system permease subunit